MASERYRVLAGPEGYLPPAAAQMGVEIPEPGCALVEGECTPEGEALTRVARALLGARNPVFFVGPLLLWAWKEGVAEKAAVVKELADAVGARVIPMPDYRPKYPMINPAVEINPNHPNLTIWHNEIDVAAFVGVHCHYANMALKIVRGGTDCFTIALCAEVGHEDAMVSLRDVGIETMRRLIEIVQQMKGGD